MWEYTHDLAVPLKPNFELKCSICGGSCRPKEWYPHLRTYKEFGDQPRIDIWYKCDDCFHVWVHGVEITMDYYTEMTDKMKKVLGRIRPLHILEALGLRGEE